jgi:hypothetical protein
MLLTGVFVGQFLTGAPQDPSECGICKAHARTREGERENEREPAARAVRGPLHTAPAPVASADALRH